ncbi:MAG: hypothetical protein KBD64_08350 [Gammaproteobacteria bacterium]|jgi:hypothetical protein|nr:hypothetical protein [Gammaproteobacteria bacterium]
MRVFIDADYAVGDMVYLKTDPEQLIFIVTGYLVRSGYLLYELTQGLTTMLATDIEISPEKNVINL